MSRGVSIQVEGLDKLKKKFGSIPENLKAEVDAEMSAVATGFVNRAVEDAPVDVGTIRNQITSNRVGEMDYEIVSGASYSPYVEFGTKSRVKIPAGLESYAAQFRGKGKGDYYDFLNAILDWVKRKGIGGTYKGSIEKLSNKKKDQLVQVAEAIAFSIIRHGVRPHPFFFKQMPMAQAELNKNLKEVVKRALEK